MTPSRQYLVFDELVDTARHRGLRVELHDDGITYDAKTGRSRRRITDVRVTNSDRQIVLQYPAQLEQLDEAAGALLQRLPA